MTTTQIITLARNKILEATSENVSDSTVLIYANLAYIDIIRRVFPASQIGSATVTFTSGQGTLPSDFGTLYGDPIDTSNNIYPELSIDDFQKQISSKSVTIENGVIKVYPTDTGSLQIKYYKTYPELSGGVNPTINSYFHEPIVYGIVYRALEDLQDEALSKYYRDLYEADLIKRISVQSGYEETNQRGSELFRAQSLINDGSPIDDPNKF